MSTPLEFDGAHHVPRGSLVVFRSPVVGHPPDMAKRLEEVSNMIASKVGHHEFATVCLGPEASVEVLDEEAMRRLGWVRVPF